MATSIINPTCCDSSCVTSRQMVAAFNGRTRIIEAHGTVFLCKGDFNQYMAGDLMGFFACEMVFKCFGN